MRLILATLAAIVLMSVSAFAACDPNDETTFAECVGPQGLPGADADAREAVAVGIALAAPTYLSDSENFAITGNLGYYDDKTALAATGIVRITGGLSVNAGFGISTEDSNEWGARAGVRFGW